MSDFRKSKDVLGNTHVIRKGSKYDKDAKKYADDVVGIIPDRKLREAHGDDMMGINVKVAAEMGKDKQSKALGRSSNDTYEDLSPKRPKASKGRKDFQFFKHTIKGK